MSRTSRSKTRCSSNRGSTGRKSGASSPRYFFGVTLSEKVALRAVTASAGKGLQRLSRWALGLTLLPLVWSVGNSLAGMIPAVGMEGFQSWWRYAAGAAVYIAIERLFQKPMWLYVVGHELTHAVTGLLSGAKIHSFKAHSDGGEVRLSKSNAFIALSPYVVPLYATLVIGIYAAVRHWWAHPGVVQGFQFLLGAALAFHVSLTVSAMHRRQTDLKVLGFFLSGVLILLGNSLIFAVLGISLFTKTPTFPQFARVVGTETLIVWKKGWVFAVDEVKRLNENRTRPGKLAKNEDVETWTR